MNKFLFFVALFIYAISISAQDTVVEDSADVAVADSILTDSIITDRKLTIQQRIEKLLDAKLFKTSQVGIMVYDLEADSVVYAYNEKQTLRPASTMKLTTAIAALSRLGGSYRYSTTLKYRGTIYDASKPSDDTEKKGVLIGDIIAVGGMDPRFNTDDMNAFVETLVKERVDTIYGDVKEDRSFKDSDMLGEGWCWDDKNPILTPLLWNRKDNFVYKLTQMIRDAGIVIRPKSEIPKDSLGNLSYPIGNGKEQPKVLCTRYHSIDQVLMKMMKESDNLYAETMLYQIAANVAKGRHPGRAKDAMEAIKALVKSVGMNPSDYRFADGSGLSLYNYQSPELQTALLRYAYKNGNIFEHLYPSLPVAAQDGTLKSRMQNTKAAKNVHAKTGTLSGISSLAGYVTAANGNMLCFSIINQGVLRNAPAKAFQDRVCNILCTYGAE